MASPAQIAANRRNARKSTGPTTAEGKSRASHNAITHGALSKKCTAHPAENPAAFDQLVAGLTAEHHPVGAAQKLCILQIALAIWKINLEDIIRISVIHARYRVPLQRSSYESFALLRSLRAKAKVRPAAYNMSELPNEPNSPSPTKRTQFTFPDRCLPPNYQTNPIFPFSTVVSRMDELY